VSFNQMIGVGNLTADPEIKYHDGGGAKTRFSIAINRYGAKRDDPPLYLNVECWDKLAESTAENLRKGRKVLVMGELRLDRYEDKDGNKREKWYVNARTVQFLDRPPEDDDRSSGRDDDRGRGRDDGRRSREDEPRRGRSDDRDDRGRSSDRGRTSRPASRDLPEDDLPF
jgi:single-strand DNA-binding protein